MGLLDDSDWGGAKWIQSPQPPQNRGVTFDLGGAREARYVRLDVSKLGLPTDEGGSRGVVSRIQLVEFQVLAPNGTNVAFGKSVSVYDQFACPGCGTKLLTDGKIISPGYMSRDSKTQEISPSKWVQIDLGSVQSVDRVVLFPRTDARLADGQIPGFPVDFTIRASATSSTRPTSSRRSSTSPTRRDLTSTTLCPSSPSPSRPRRTSPTRASTSQASAPTRPR